jgi:hypothetical protein
MTIAKAGMDQSAFVGEAADRDHLVAGDAKFKPNGRLVMHVPDYKAPGVATLPHRP